MYLKSAAHTIEFSNLLILNRLALTLFRTHHQGSCFIYVREIHKNLSHDIRHNINFKYDLKIILMLFCLREPYTAAMYVFSAMNRWFSINMIHHFALFRMRCAVAQRFVFKWILSRSFSNHADCWIGQIDQFVSLAHSKSVVQSIFSMRRVLFFNKSDNLHRPTPLTEIYLNKCNGICT